MKFKVGSYVKPVGRHNRWEGKKCIIKKIVCSVFNNKMYAVVNRVEDNYKDSFYLEDLTLYDNWEKITI